MAENFYSSGIPFWKITRPAGTRSPPHLLLKSNSTQCDYFGSVVLLAVLFSTLPELVLSLLWILPLNFFPGITFWDLQSAHGGMEAHISSLTVWGLSLHLHPPSAIFTHLWGHTRFDFEFSVQESQGPLGNGALSLHRMRMIRGNQLLPLYSISHLSLLLDTLCCLPRRAIHQSLRKMTRGRKQCQFTKSMGKSPAHCQVKYNIQCFCLMFDRIWKKNDKIYHGVPLSVRITCSPECQNVIYMWAVVTYRREL